MYINKALIYGNLTRDPETRALPSGMKVCNFSVATNRSWKDKSGVLQSSVDYHNVVMFGKPAEVASQYLKKGAAVYVEGRMQTRSWDGQDGQKKYRTEIVSDGFQFGPKMGGGEGHGAGASAGASSGGVGVTGSGAGGVGGAGASSGQSKSSPKGNGASKSGEDAGPVTGAGAPADEAIQYPEEEINADDIPF